MRLLPSNTTPSVMRRRSDHMSSVGPYGNSSVNSEKMAPPTA